MITITVGNIGSSITEITGKVSLPAERLKFWINLILQLEHEMADISRAPLVEKHFIPSVFHHFNMRNDNILARAINNPGINQKHIDALFNTMINAGSKPYREAMTAIQTLITLLLQKAASCQLIFTES
ncbi:MAG: hypothetical protein A2W80_09500 [Candidatus Riflebacteria bacterium GWC2_50_8]|nr:MAG: hypothetical protein A2W80_09500 [Candidatus Riflebacteria bacterium GWC2_50_8]